MKVTREADEFFPDFDLAYAKLPHATLRYRLGGSGVPVLLLHGHPRTHTTWHRVAPILARDYTVVCPDLRGFGKSSKPAGDETHVGSSKREKALDCLHLMNLLGFKRFAVVGHDRGLYTAFRLAMDHPDSVSHLVVIDGIPILEAYERTDARFAIKWWHWFFFMQPDKPEQAINANPAKWYSASKEEMGVLSHADYLAAISDPLTIHAMVEDYRAGPGIDSDHDRADREAGRKIRCPTLALWALDDDLQSLYGKVLEIWQKWCLIVEGFGVRSGHHMAEEVPDLLAGEVEAFLKRWPGR